MLCKDDFFVDAIVCLDHDFSTIKGSEWGDLVDAIVCSDYDFSTIHNQNWDIKLPLLGQKSWFSWQNNMGRDQNCNKCNNWGTEKFDLNKERLFLWTW